jgi:hypothetical protein
MKMKTRTATDYRIFCGDESPLEIACRLDWAIDRAIQLGCTAVWREVHPVHGNGEDAYVLYTDAEIVERELVWTNDPALRTP